MKYTLVYMKKNGKVVGMVGCDTDHTRDYLVIMWKKAPKRKHGTCLVINNETKEETFYTK